MIVITETTLALSWKQDSVRRVIVAHSVYRAQCDAACCAHVVGGAFNVTMEHVNNPVVDTSALAVVFCVARGFDTASLVAKLDLDVVEALVAAAYLSMNDIPTRDSWQRLSDRIPDGRLKEYVNTAVTTLKQREEAAAAREAEKARAAAASVPVGLSWYRKLGTLLLLPFRCVVIAFPGFVVPML